MPAATADLELDTTTPVDVASVDDSATSEKFSSRMPIYFFVVSASLLIAIAFLGNNLILNINADNTTFASTVPVEQRRQVPCRRRPPPLPCRSSESTA